MTLHAHLAVVPRDCVKRGKIEVDGIRIEPASFLIEGETSEDILKSMIRQTAIVLAKSEYPSDEDKFLARIEELEGVMR